MVQVVLSEPKCNPQDFGAVSFSDTVTIQESVQFWNILTQCMGLMIFCCETLVKGILVTRKSLQIYILLINKHGDFNHEVINYLYRCRYQNGTISVKEKVDVERMRNSYSYRYGTILWKYINLDKSHVESSFLFFFFISEEKPKYVILENLQNGRGKDTGSLPKMSDFFMFIRHFSWFLKTFW